MPGVRLGVTMAGIRKADRRDLSVIELIEGSSVAGVFTSNRFCAAPVQLCRQHGSMPFPVELDNGLKLVWGVIAASKQSKKEEDHEP